MAATLLGASVHLLHHSVLLSSSPTTMVPDCSRAVVVVAVFADVVAFAQPNVVAVVGSPCDDDLR